MSAATIAALATAIPSVLGSVTALIWAIRGHAKAQDASDRATQAQKGVSVLSGVVTSHLQSHDKQN